MAQELDITVELLIKRFICEGLLHTYGEGPCIPANTLDDFLVKNGALNPSGAATKTHPEIATKE